MFSLPSQAAAAPASPTLPLTQHGSTTILDTGYTQVPSALERGQKRTAWFWPHSMSAFERLPWSVGHPLCPTQEMSKGAPVAAERTRPQPDCCEGFRQAVPGGRGFEAGGAGSRPAQAGVVLSPSSAASTSLPTHLQPRLQGGLREGTEG